MRPAPPTLAMLAAAGLAVAAGVGASVARRATGPSGPSGAENRATVASASGVANAAPATRGSVAGGDPGYHAFYFTRGIYSGSRGYYGYGGDSWSTDYPKADRQFLFVLRRLIDIDAYPEEHPVAFDDPELRRYPFVYALEVGYMHLTPSEVEGLRSFLLAGGFLMIDDFWGTREWRNFEREIHRVLPGREIVDVPPDHPLFDMVYHIRDVLQVPNVGNAQTGRYWERDGRVPHVKGILDDHGRLMVMINWNTDLGDAWEWAEQPFYPLDRSTFAMQMGVNSIVYAMSH